MTSQDCFSRGAARRLRHRLSGVALAACAAVALSAAAPGEVHAQGRSSPSATSATLRAVTAASGLDHPWSLAFLPSFSSDGRALVTERPGRLRIVDLRSGQVGPAVAGVPDVAARGQGGLLDVVLDPAYADNAVIYLSYSEPGEGGTGIAIAKARLDTSGSEPRLTGLQVIFRERPKARGASNLGGRLVFGRDGKLYASVGDRFNLRDEAQDPSSLRGKVIRIDANGQAPSDNPFVGRGNAAPEVYTIGHRNMQGMALHPVTGQLWTQEHGPQGGDEVNIEAAGKNYGWPVITYGAEYGSGAKIGEGTAKPGMEQPLTKWVPSIAPSGMAFLTSHRYPGWEGNLFIGALRGQLLVRLELDGDKVVREERLLESLRERIRDVRQGPDGWLYLLTDSSEGRVLRIER